MTTKQLYMTEDGSEIYFPAAHYTYNEARGEAASYAEDMIWGYGRSRYLGKRNVPLHDCGDDWWDCQECPAVPTWVFETYEGTYRG